MNREYSPEAVERALKLQDGTILAAEVRRLQAEAHEMQCPACGATTRALLPDQAERAELEQLRAASAAVVRHWDGAVRDTTDENPLWNALDALARVLAKWAEDQSPDVAEAIGRALLGEDR